MSVSELINLLHGLDRPGAEVMLAKDAEGNEFLKLAEFTDGHFLPLDKFGRQSYDELYHDDEDEREGVNVDIVVLWPL